MYAKNQTPTNGFLVLGAGELGMPVLRNLATSARAAGTDVVALLRPSTVNTTDPIKSKEIAEIRSRGIDIVPADLATASAAELASIFGRFDTVVSCTGFVAGPGTQLKLARAALESGVRRYVPWQFGVDYDVIPRGQAGGIFDEQMDVRQLLRSQDRTEWIIVSTGMFTSFLFEPSFGVVDLKGAKVHALGSWDTAVTVTTPDDIGVLTTEILFAEPRLANEVVYTAGDTITYGRLADVVEEVLERKVERVEWTVPKLQEDLANDPEDLIKKYRMVFAEGTGVAWPVERTFNAQRGIAVQDLEGWARENLLARAPAV